MSLCGRMPPVGWIVFLFALVIILPEGRTQTRTRKPAVRPCTVTLDEIDSLVVLLEDIEQVPVEESEETGDETEAGPESSDQQTQCTRELTRLRKSILGLQERYHQLKQQNSNTVDVREYEVRKNRYEQQKRDLEAKLSSIESRLNQKDRLQLSTLKRKIKEVEKQLNAAVTALDQERQSNMNRYATLVANKVNTFNLKEATKNFQKLLTYNANPYSEIMKQTTNDWNMMHFLAGVNFIHQPIAGYEALIDSMIQRHTLRGPISIELLKHIQSIILARDSNQQQRALNLLKKFKMNAV